MRTHVLRVCAFLVTWKWAYAADPCEEGEYNLLPRADYRGGGCEYNAEKPTCDATLISGWYRAVGRQGDLKMFENEPDFLTCGTKYPIWMNGTHPNSTEGIVERTVRQVLTEEATWSINVKNCQDEYYVYELNRTSSCPQAYCFGMTPTDPCPSFDPCDIYEYEDIPYDSERSGSCTSSEADNCATEAFTSNWVVFRDSSQGFLNVSSTPLDTGTCRSVSPMWIKETISTDSDDIKTQKLCIASENDNCATVSTIRSKSCRWFEVYEVPINISCGRLCLDDPSASCIETVPDPCDASVYHELPRAEYRGGACSYNSQKPTCDAALLSGWYRANGESGNLKMQTTIAELLTCGTKFPIWMNATHPSATDGEIDVTLLQAGSEDEIIIKVKNCNDEFYVYELQPTSSCPEAYCFGYTNSDPCPAFDPCDMYEHEKIKYDAVIVSVEYRSANTNVQARSNACRVEASDDCVPETFSLPWIAFKDSAGGFLNVSISSSGVGACGSRTPMWIKETLSTDSKGISIEVVCIETTNSSCGKEINIRSKTCKWFTVYEPPADVECSRLCLDDPGAICPTEPAYRTSTQRPGRGDRKDEGRSSKQHLWVIAVVLSIAIAAMGIAFAFITYRYRNKHSDRPQNYRPQKDAENANTQSHGTCTKDENAESQRHVVAGSELSKQMQTTNIASSQTDLKTL